MNRGAGQGGWAKLPPGAAQLEGRTVTGHDDGGRQAVMHPRRALLPNRPFVVVMFPAFLAPVH